MLEPKIPAEYPERPAWLDMKTTTVSNGTLRLEPLGSDPDRFRQLAHDVWTDPEVIRFNGATDFLTPYAVDQWIDHLAVSSGEIYWAVVRVEDSKPVGITGWQNIEWTRFGEKSCEVSRQLLPEGRGHGFGKQLDLMHLAMAKKSGFTRLYANVHEGNMPSLKSRAPQFGEPVIDHNDFDGKDHYIFTADLKQVQLPPDLYLVYAQTPAHKPRKKK